MTTRKHKSGTRFKFRKADLSDLDEVYSNECSSYPTPWTRKMLRDCLIGEYSFFVLLDEKVIIGHIVFQEVMDEIQLHNLCVSPNFQKRGLGHQCLDFLFEFAKAKQLMQLILEVRVSNSIAINLYAARGFRHIGIRKDYYQSQLGKEDALVMKAQIEK